MRVRPMEEILHDMRESAESGRVYSQADIRELADDIERAIPEGSRFNDALYNRSLDSYNVSAVLRAALRMVSKHMCICCKEAGRADACGRCLEHGFAKGAEEMAHSVETIHINRMERKDQ